MAKLFRDLQRAWECDGASSDACSALARWAEAQPALAAYTSPAGLAAAAHHRGAEEAKALVDGLTEKAPTDAWAGRTALHALLPGLAAISRYQLDMVGPAREPNRAAFCLGRRVGCGELSEALVGEALPCPALAIGLGESKAAATIRSGLRAPRRSPESGNGVR